MNYSTLIDVATLAAELDNPAWVVLDCRFDLMNPAWGETEFAAEHIPSPADVKVFHGNIEA